jgi:hypothetical protein
MVEFILRQRARGQIGHVNEQTFDDGMVSADESFAARQLLPSPLSGEHTLRVAKPWKCRLRLHDWDDRENPETHEHYEVCLRCNAYRERGRAAPGAGGAGIAGSGMG